MKPSTLNQSFKKLFLIGIATWGIGSFVLFAAAILIGKQQGADCALMWTCSHWWISFTAGLLAILLSGIISKNPFKRALHAYIIPMAATLAISCFCLAIYPDPAFKENLLGWQPGILPIFYLFGIFWMALRNKDSYNFIRGVLPPIIGGSMMLMFVIVPVFQSNEFIYRNAFELTIDKLTTPDGALVAEGVLEIRKPGHYKFTLPHLNFNEFEDPRLKGEIGKDKITWGIAGEPGEGHIGKFPLQLRWEKTTLPIHGINPHLPEFIPQANLDVRDTATPQTVIYTVTTQLPVELKK